MIVFLYGPDGYRRDAKKRSLVAEFAKKHPSVGVGRFDMEEEGASEALAAFLKSRSMFDSAKLALVERAFAADGEPLAGDLARLRETKEITVIVSGEEAPPKALRFLLKEPVLSQKFDLLDGAEWSGFVKREAARLGIGLTAKGAHLLAGAYEGDTWGLVTELEKMSFLRGEVGEEALKRLDIELAPDFWNTFSGLKSGRLAERLYAAEQLFGMNEPAGKMFNMLAYQMPHKLPAFAAYDEAVKTGKLDYEEALVDMVLGS
jgi:DNA polymerase III delta subunit